MEGGESEEGVENSEEQAEAESLTDSPSGSAELASSIDEVATTQDLQIEDANQGKGQEPKPISADEIETDDVGLRELLGVPVILN